MRCIACAEVDQLDPFDQHAEWCALRVFSGDNRIGLTKVMEWAVSTVAMPGLPDKPGLWWETMVTYQGVVGSVTAYKTENEARYWHIRTVMDIIRHDGKPPPVDYIDPKTELLMLLMGHQVSVWCQICSTWDCGVH